MNVLDKIINNEPLKENNVSLVVLPNNDLEFLRSIDIQFRLGEISNE